jgi:hypothetical protein
MVWPKIVRGRRIGRWRGIPTLGATSPSSPCCPQPSALEKEVLDREELWLGPMSARGRGGRGPSAPIRLERRLELHPKSNPTAPPATTREMWLTTGMAKSSSTVPLEGRKEEPRAPPQRRQQIPERGRRVAPLGRQHCSQRGRHGRRIMGRKRGWQRRK